jgi:hypothetical protein
MQLVLPVEMFGTIVLLQRNSFVQESWQSVQEDEL